MRLPSVALVAVLSIIGGCAAQEELIAKSADVPPGIDLSGQWRLRADSQDTVKRISDAELEAAGAKERIIPVPERQSQQSRQRSSAGTLVHVFLETGSSLKITQTQYGLFISFDRSVVEEFRFGEHRMVSVGAVEAQRVSGWDGTQLVVETLGKNGMKLTDRFYLTDGGDTLKREITLRSKKLEEESVVQEFDRVE